VTLVTDSDDRYAIERLKYRYFRALDLKLWDVFEDCFVPDATGAYAGLDFADRASLVAYMRENLGPSVISLHNAHHPEIDIDGDTATGIWYLEDTVLAPDFNFALEGAAFYEDRYRRTDAGWRIAHTGYTRTFDVQWSTADVASFKFQKGTAYDHWAAK